MADLTSALSFSLTLVFVGLCCLLDLALATGVFMASEKASLDTCVCLFYRGTFFRNA